MTREEYIVMRNNGNFNIIYEYYKEHFDSVKHTPFFSLQELAQMLPAIGMNINLIMDKCVKHFDDKFTISLLKDAEGNIIKVL